MHTPSILQTPRCAALALTALLCATATAQTARLDDSCNPQLTPMQQRLYDKAAAGTDALRDFMFIRRRMLQLDVFDTGTWAESVRQSQSACMKRLALAQPEPRPQLRLSEAASQ